MIAKKGGIGAAVKLAAIVVIDRTSRIGNLGGTLGISAYFPAGDGA